MIQNTLHIKTTVMPGGKIEIVDEELPVGESVDVVVRHPSASAAETARRSAVDILDGAPGHRLFKTPDDVKNHLTDERSSWDG